MTKARVAVPSPPMTISFHSFEQRWYLIVLGAIACGIAYHWATFQPIDSKYDNIGNVSDKGYLSYGPIDAVYTWVNGTDLRWKAEKDFWQRQWLTALTGQAASESVQESKDKSASDNRFRDNEELRFSLRSLEKYAPWIRHIYIVTDGQIPSWLNLDSPRISIVPHRDIFPNTSYLPVFASPAIESNLVNIPGLSEHFLYFNDDVFLGSHITPSDFISVDGVQKIYFAWEIPHCSALCDNENLGNGICDFGCNTTSCDYDLGDCGCIVNSETDNLHCDEEKVKDVLLAKLLEEKQATLLKSDSCREFCTYEALGDGKCESTCDTPECGFDGGDCNMSHVHSSLSTASIFTKNLMYIEDGSSRLFWIAEVFQDVPAMIFNLSSVFGVNGSIYTAEHDNPMLVRQAIVHEDQMILLVVFGREEYSNEGRTGSCSLEIRGRTVGGEEQKIQIFLVRGNTTVNSIGIQQHEHDDSTSPTNENIAVAGLYTFLNQSLTSEYITSPIDVHASKIYVSGSMRIERKPAPIDLEAGKHSSEIETQYAVDNTDQKKALIFNLYLPRVHTEVGRKLDRDTQLQFEVTLRDRAIEHERAQSEVLLNFRRVFTCMLHSSFVATATPEKPAEFEAKASEPLDKATSFNDDSPQCVNMHDQGLSVQIKITLPQPAGHLRYNVGKKAEEHEMGSKLDYEAERHDHQQPEHDTFPRVEPRLFDGQLCFLDVARPQEKFCFSIALTYYDRQNVALTVTTAKDDMARNDAKYTNENEPYYMEKDAQSAYQDGTLTLDEAPVEEPVDDSTAANDEMSDREKEEGRLVCALKRNRLERYKMEIEWEAKMRQLSSHSESADLMTGTIKWLQGFLSDTTLVEKSPESDLEHEYARECATTDDDLKDLFVTPSLHSFTFQEREAARASTDTFGDSLRFVNKLFTRAFGKPSERRRVVSHMPFLIKKSTMLELKSHWPQEFEATSSHRFRHPHDMQFSFSYFHYLINRHKLHPPTIEEIWAEYFDVNRNGVLDYLEMLTLASMVHGDTPSETSIEEVKNCIQPPHAVTEIEKDTKEGRLKVSETLHPHITLESLKKCKEVAEKLISNVRRKIMYEPMSEAEVTFHMLSDNPTYALGQMLNTRARRTKFVCINDDMKNPTQKVHQVLRELFLAFWPNQSQFELPHHLQNRYLHIDEYNLAQQRLRKLYLGLILTVVILGLSVYWHKSIWIFRKRQASRPRTSSASILKRERIKADRNVIIKSPTSASSPRSSPKVDCEVVGNKMKQ